MWLGSFPDGIGAWFLYRESSYSGYIGSVYVEVYMVVIRHLYDVGYKSGRCYLYGDHGRGSIAYGGD